MSPRRLIALEIENPGHELYLPMSYRLESAIGNEPYRVVQREPELVLFRAQIYTPKQFVFRIVLPQPVLADRLRLVVEQPMPAIDVVVHEIRVYEAP